MAEPDALGKESYVFSTGGPVWGTDWCPVPSSSDTQYLAVSTLRDIQDQPTIGTRRSSAELGSIQIWSFDSARAIAARCEIVLCIKGSGVLDLKWMPLGARDQVSLTLLRRES
jgi:transcription factor C subunit 6